MLLGTALSLSLTLLPLPHLALAESTPLPLPQLTSPAELFLLQHPSATVHPAPALSTFDVAFLFGESTETTPSGRTLPSKYVSSVSDMVLKLRVALAADAQDRGSQFWEKAEGAKDSIRVYLQQWRGKGVAQEVDLALETALRELSGFYSKNGPTALMPAGTRDVILSALSDAESAL